MLYPVAVFAPLLGSLIAGLLGRAIGDRASQAVTIICMAVAAVCGTISFLPVIDGDADQTVISLGTWMHAGGFDVQWALRYDTLSAVMVAMVTLVSTLIHIYSVGYMAHETSPTHRFFSYLSLFTFAMLMLVTADNLVQLFFGWEGVGLVSYLLIGYRYDRPAACRAAIKAMIVNRVGDLSFAVGIGLVFFLFGSIQFPTIFAALHDHHNAIYHVVGGTFRAYEVIGVLLFIGACGKSAQIFLHTWLPDAMEGPTPVSALIHAATMVTAGVFLMARMSPLLEDAPGALGLITFIGATTCFFAATIGCVQNDIKRVIAYSTCSQLGYMFFAAGVGAYQSAMFHLFTHAFFKALLFLGAGSVIHAMHHEQDMRKMGGLWKLIPITFAVMTIGTIAITGLGIPGLELGFAGFYSKDSILGASFASGEAGQPLGYFAWVVGVFVAGLTSFYSWRLAFFTFNGHARWGDHGHGVHAQEDHAHPASPLADDHASRAQIETHSEPDVSHHGHDDHAPHESPWVMLIPLLVLSVGAIFSGGVFFHYFVGSGQAAFWKGAIFNGPHNHVLEGAEHAPMWVGLSPLIAAVIGLLVAAYMYLLREGLGERLAARGGPLYTFFYNKWFFDELYQATFVRGAKALGDLLWKGGDEKIIDGLGPNGVSWLMGRFGRGLSWLQNGYIYTYAFVMLIGVAGLLTFALMAWVR
jgi:NADH-quinone oxidoreductase subunit L